MAKQIDIIYISKEEPNKNVAWVYPLEDGTFSFRLWMYNGWTSMFPDGGWANIILGIKSLSNSTTKLGDSVNIITKNISSMSQSVSNIAGELSNVSNKVNLGSLYKVETDNDFYLFYSRQYDSDGKQIDDYVYKIPRPDSTNYSISSSNDDDYDYYNLVNKGETKGDTIKVPKRLSIQDIPDYEIEKDENGNYHLVSILNGVKQRKKVPIELNKDFLLKEAYKVHFDENGNEYRLDKNGDLVQTGVVNVSNSNGDYLKFIIRSDDNEEKEPLYINIEDLVVSTYEGSKHILIENKTISVKYLIPQYDSFDNIPNDEKIIQYIGPTTDEYTQFYFYRKNEYEWVQTDIQPRGGGYEYGMSLNSSPNDYGGVGNVGDNPYLNLYNKTTERVEGSVRFMSSDTVSVNCPVSAKDGIYFNVKQKAIHDKGTNVVGGTANSTSNYTVNTNGVFLNHIETREQNGNTTKTVMSSNKIYGSGSCVVNSSNGNIEIKVPQLEYESIYYDHDSPIKVQRLGGKQLISSIESSNGKTFTINFPQSASRYMVYVNMKYEGSSNDIVHYNYSGFNVYLKLTEGHDMNDTKQPIIINIIKLY